MAVSGRATRAAPPYPQIGRGGATTAGGRAAGTGGFGRPRKAVSSPWSMESTRTSLICLRISSGTSRRSLSFLRGRMTIPAPERCAARILLLSPPMGRTRPRSVISPVWARSLRTGMPVSALTMAVAMVMPAEGPSLGMAPAGTWMWSVFFSKTSRVMPSSSACARLQQRPAPAGPDGPPVAAHLGDHESRGRADLVLGLQLAVHEARRAEVLEQLLAIHDDLALAAPGPLAGGLAA